MNALHHGKVASRPRAWCHSSLCTVVSTVQGWLNALGFSLGTYLILDGGLKIVGSLKSRGRYQQGFRKKIQSLIVYGFCHEGGLCFFFGLSAACCLLVSDIAISAT